MDHNFSCKCVILRKASNNLTKIYDSALIKVGLKITQLSTLKNIKKFGKTNIRDLSSKYE